MTFIRIGTVRDQRKEVKPFGIRSVDRRRHVYIIGKTGVGKTTLLQNMAIADIRAGNGLGVIDPHGDFSERLLHYVPRRRIPDVIYVDPADREFPIALNLFEEVPTDQRPLVASALISIFQKLFPKYWGLRIEYLLRNATLALLEYPHTTLLELMKFLTEQEWREKVVKRVTDPVVHDFWESKYPKAKGEYRQSLTAIQSRLGQFLTSPLIRNIIAQNRKKVQPREIIDERKIFVMNLAKGRIGEDATAFLGALMTIKLYLAAMSRIDLPEEQRQDFYLYVDEFQSFATPTFAEILSEARKYHLNLILSHQYLAQLEDEVRDAVLGNVGTLLCFRIGGEDAPIFEREFYPEFDREDLVKLDKFQIYLRLLIDGVSSRPFSAYTLPPLPQPAVSHKEKIIRHCRIHLGTPLDRVEKDIVIRLRQSEMGELLSLRQ